MIVDCTTCPVRGRQCGDCVVTVLLGPRSPELTLATQPPPIASLPTERLPTELALDAAEHMAVSRLVGAGLFDARAVPGLRARREPMGDWGSDRDVG